MYSLHDFLLNVDHVHETILRQRIVLTYHVVLNAAVTAVLVVVAASVPFVPAVYLVGDVPIGVLGLCGDHSGSVPGYDRVHALLSSGSFGR